MLKRSLFLVAILNSFAISQDVNLERFFGLELGYERVKEKNVIDALESDNGIEFGLKTGVQSYEWRTIVSGHFFKKDSQEYSKAILSFDRFVGVGLYETEDIIMKPYIGLHTGWLNLSKTNGLIYGVEAGVVWALSDGVDIDFGYRFSSSEVDRVDNLNSLSLSINYIF